MVRTEHRCALITGASSGIGEAIARALPQSTELLLTGRDRTRLEALAAELGNPDRTVTTLAADLTDGAARDRLVALARLRPVDLLVNNAGIARFGRFVENPADVESAMVTLNCLVPVAITRALLPGMIERARAERRRAGLILVASTSAFMPLPRLATYSATKAFDLFLAEALAAELAEEPVDVLALCPGATRSRFFERAGFPRRPPGPLHKPARVAREALAALGGEPVHVVGGSNRAMTGLARLMPRALLRAGARRAMARFARSGAGG